MNIEMNILLAASGLVIGILLGIVIQRSRFCMTAVVSHWVLMKDTRQIHVYLTTICVAIIGTLWLEYEGLVAIGDSTYRNANINWLCVIIGGGIFGLGAVFAGGCIGRVLVLTGEGNLSALLALLTVALGATATYTGVLEPLRIWISNIFSFEVTTGDASILALFDIPVWVALLATTAVLISVVIYSYRSSSSIRLIMTGVTIGLLVVTGWWITGWLAIDEFSTQKPASLTFSGPLTRTALYITIGNEPQSFFGILMVLGVVTGSYLSSILTRSFRITPPTPTSVLRTLSGGFMMGTGAIMAGGCNIGQGITGMSTLSIESILAVASIFTGMFIGVKWLQHAENHGSLWTFPHLHIARPKALAR